MNEGIVYDFDRVVSREGTHAEKYESRQRYFGKANVAPFWVADMDLPAPGFLVEALRERIAHPMFGYTVQYGEIHEAIRWWMQSQHGAGVEDAEHILLSPSVVTSICMAIQAFTEPGDAVALLSPVYGPFFSCTAENGRRVVDCPLQVVDGRFEIDFAGFETRIRQERARLLLLSNPHNPGGRVWRRDELEKIVRICSENGVVVFCDEIHSDIVYPSHRHETLLNLPAARACGIVAHSIGKTFNCSGLQASFAIVPDDRLRARFHAAQNRAHVGDINLLGKVALAAALSPAGAEYKRQLVDYLHGNVRFVCERLGRLDPVAVMEPEATFLVWSDFRALGRWQDVFARLVHRANVALSGGQFFGPAGEGWFRINCGHPRQVLLAAVDRMVAEFGP